MDEQILKVDPAVDVVTPRSGSVVFLTPNGPFTLRDRMGLVRTIIGALKAGVSRSAVMASLGSDPERLAAEELIGLLIARGVLQEVGELTHTGCADPMREWIRHYGGAATATALLANVDGDGRLAQSVATGLRDAGFGTGGRLRVIALDTPDHPRLLAANADAMTAGVRLLPVWLNRSSVHLGPSIIPGETACLACLLHRQQAAKRRAEPVDLALTDGVSISPSVISMAVALTVTEALRMALDAYVTTDFGVAHHFDLVAMRLSAGKVVRLPRCAVCDRASKGW